MQRHRYATLENGDLGMLLLTIVLAAVAGVVIQGMFPGHHPQNKGQRGAAQTQLNAFAAALVLYKQDNGRFPTPEQGLSALVRKPVAEPVPARWQPYLADLATVPPDPWGGAYEYRIQGGDCTVRSLGADGRPGGEGDAADLIVGPG